MKIHTIILSFCFFSLSLMGQKGSSIFLLSGSVFTMGEHVSGVLIFDGLNIDGKVFRAEVTDTDGTIQQAFYFKGDLSTATFSFDLPYINTSTSYMVSVITLDPQNQPTVLAELPLLCLHTEIADINAKMRQFRPTADVTFAEGEVIKMVKSSDNKHTIHFLDDNATLVHMNISDDIWDGQANAVFLHRDFTQSEVDIWPNKIFIQGHLEKKNIPTACNILGMYDQMNDRFLFSKSDAKGHFTFLTDTFTGNRSFQIMPYGSEFKQAIVAQERRIKNESSLDNIPLSFITERWKDYQMKNKIDQYFNLTTIENKNFIQEPLATKIPAQKSYIPDNFKSFEAFHQFCKENEVPLQFKLKDKKYDAFVNVPSHFAKQFRMVTQDPLFNVNGLLTKNEHMIATLKSADIASFDMYYDIEALRKSYNIFGAETIIKIKTKTNLSLLNDYEKRNVMLIKGFQSISKDNQSKIKDKLAKGGPVFEPHLYFGTLVNGQSFHTTDDKTKYTIHLIVKDKNEKLSFVKQMIDFK